MRRVRGDAPAGCIPPLPRGGTPRRSPPPAPLAPAAAAPARRRRRRARALTAASPTAATRQARAPAAPQKRRAAPPQRAPPARPRRGSCARGAASARAAECFDHAKLRACCPARPCGALSACAAVPAARPGGALDHGRGTRALSALCPSARCWSFPAAPETLAWFSLTSCPPRQRQPCLACRTPRRTGDRRSCPRRSCSPR